MTKKRDLTGQRFGRLLVIKEAPREIGQKSIHWICKCDCGNECVKTSQSLFGGTKSCGCIVKEIHERAVAKREHTKAVIQRAKQTLKRKCPYPCNYCDENKKGKCCVMCLKHATCDDACHNLPERCGYFDTVGRTAAKR